MKAGAAILFALVLFVAGGLRADQVEMRNGDRYTGKVISLTANSIVLQSDVLGKITLSRGNVANINLGAGAVTNQAKVASSAPTNASPQTAAAGNHAGADTNLVEQIRKQFLSEAGPAANNKYDELVGELFSGKFDINSLRAEAKAAADQIRAVKSQGGDVGESLNAYLAVLDHFLKETANSTTGIPDPVRTTNSTPVTTITR